MKSIKQQYIDLTEGKMSQANFMRNLRMTMPQYVTNVTSFNDAVKILRNKGILTEARPGYSTDPLKNVPADTSNWEVTNTDDELEAAKQLSDQELQKLLSDEGLEDFWTGDKESTLLNLPTDVLKDLTRLSEAKKAKLTADQVNNDELRMGIRVEMEHTDDVEKAKKIALDHLAENPFYYTQLKLSGVDTKALPSKEKKAIAKKKDETEMVDKANQMKTPKGVEKIKASANKAKKETNKPEKGIKMMSLVSKTTRGVKKMDATGEKMKKIKEGMEDFVNDRDYDNSDAEYEILRQIALDASDYDSAMVALEDYGIDYDLAKSIASEIHPKKTNVPNTIFDRNARLSANLNKLREAIRKMIKQGY